jgi:acyl-CoA dehydrogenase
MADKSFLNWPFFEDHHRTLAANLDAWAKDNLSENSLSKDKGGENVNAACVSIVKQLGEAGYLKYAIPRAYGGHHESLDVRSLCIIRETLARYTGLADFAFAMQGLGSGTITTGGSDELKQRYLPGVADGSKIAAFALTEPEAGSDVAAITTSAIDKGDHYLVNGEKTFISNGGIADFYTLFARTGDANSGAKGISAMIVDADTDGFSVVEAINVIAPHPLARIKFEDCKVPKDNLIGEVGTGFKAAMATLDIFRSTVGAASLGFSRRALDESLTRANERHLFGAPLFDLQLIQAKIADMALDIDAAALLIYRAGWTKDNGAPRVTREAAMAKLYATEAAQRAADQAMQIFGGLGVVKGNIAERLYREVRALRIYEGASEVQKIVIARQTQLNHQE